MNNVHPAVAPSSYDNKPTSFVILCFLPSSLLTSLPAFEHQSATALGTCSYGGESAPLPRLNSFPKPSAPQRLAWSVVTVAVTIFVHVHLDPFPFGAFHKYTPT